MAGLFVVSVINILSGLCVTAAQLTGRDFKSWLEYEERTLC